MKPTKSRGTKSSPASSAPKTAAKRDAKSANEVPVELISHTSTPGNGGPGNGGERGFSVKKSRSVRNSARHSNGKPVLELDRRGKPLPPRQRVGGIITPQ
jgi:hypothetical protein